MRRRFLALILAVAACLSLAACGNSGKTNNEANDAATAPVSDGVYTVDVETDSSMFHINEALKGKGTLTVKDGKMTVHITLASKSIVNLFPGKAEDAAKEGAALLQPTTDKVSYSDGMTEEVYSFDVPVPVLGEPFSCAIIGTKGNWYDHTITISNPEAAK